MGHKDIYLLLKEIVPNVSTFPSRSDYYEAIPSHLSASEQVALCKEAFNYLVALYLSTNYDVEYKSDEILSVKREEDMIKASILHCQPNADEIYSSSSIVGIKAELRNMLNLFKERFSDIIKPDSKIIIRPVYKEYENLFGEPMSICCIDECIYFIHSYGGMKYSWLEVAQLILEFYISNSLNKRCRAIAIYKSTYGVVEKYYPVYDKQSSLDKYLRRLIR